jgi:hypothetical protein
MMERVSAKVYILLLYILACDYKCLTCSIKSTNCVTCLASTNRLFDNNTCYCKDGFIENGTSNCLACDVRCLTCKGAATSCTTCRSSRY